MGGTREVAQDARAEALADLASRIEHTALAPDLLDSEVEKLCDEAVEHRFHGVCVPPCFVNLAAKRLEGKGPRVVTVAGFPMGYHATASKIEEARKAFDQGADEVDMVANLAALRNGRWSVVRDDMASLTTLAHMHSRVLKVIIETGMLAEGEIVKACELAAELEVDFVKTSTGFHGTGATVEAVRLMRGVLPAAVRIKASGGIRDRAFAESLVEAGAARLGTSSGPALIAPSS